MIDLLRNPIWSAVGSIATIAGLIAYLYVERRRFIGADQSLRTEAKAGSTTSSSSGSRRKYFDIDAFAAIGGGESTPAEVIGGASMGLIFGLSAYFIQLDINWIRGIGGSIFIFWHLQFFIWLLTRLKWILEFDDITLHLTWLVSLIAAAVIVTWATSVESLAQPYLLISGAA